MNNQYLTSGQYQLFSTIEHTGSRIVRQGWDQCSSLPMMLIEIAGTATPEGRGDAFGRTAHEIELAIRVRNKYLVNVTGESVDADRLWVVSSAVPERTPQGMLRGNKRPESVDILRWARQTADGLAAAYSAGLVRRDAHTGLVFIDDDGTARLAGLAATPYPVVTGGADPLAPEVIAGWTRCRPRCLRVGRDGTRRARSHLAGRRHPHGRRRAPQLCHEPRTGSTTERGHSV